MKKTIGVLMMLGMLMGCGKEKPNADLSDEATLFKYEDYSPEREQIPALIASFKEQSKQVMEFKVGKVQIEPNTDDLPIEEALWMIEGALNEHYSSPLSEWQDELMDTLFFSVSNVPAGAPSDPVLVSGYDLSTTYYSLIQQVDQLMRANAELMMADIKYVSHDAAYTQFALILFTGFPFNWSVSQDQVNPDDDWKAGLQLGKCDGTNVGRDAARRLQQIANWNIKYGFVQNYYGTHWTNMPAYHTGIQTVWEGTQPGWILESSLNKLFGHPNDVGDVTPQFCPGSTRPALSCINKQDMLSYYAELWPIIGSYQPLSPFKDVTYIKLYDQLWWCPGDPVSEDYCRHMIKYITYAIPVFVE